MARRPGACAMERLGLKAAVAAVAQAGGVPGKTGAGREGIGRICRNGRREAGVYRDARPAGAGREGIGRICGTRGVKPGFIGTRGPQAPAASAECINAAGLYSCGRSAVLTARRGVLIFCGCGARCAAHPVRSSSMVEQPAVNRRVRGSSPLCGAIRITGHFRAPVVHGKPRKRERPGLFHNVRQAQG